MNQLPGTYPEVPEGRNQTQGISISRAPATRMGKGIQVLVTTVSEQSQVSLYYN